MTATNMTVGTVAYAAPEQLSGEQLDGRADQYALAATAYNLLTGAPPFQHSNPAVTIGKHLTAPPPSLAGRRPDLAHLDPVFAVALAKSPDARFPNCQAFADALSGHPFAGAGPAQHPTIPAMITAAPRSRRTVATVVPVLLAVLLIAASAFAATQFLRPGPQHPLTRPQWQPYVDAATSYVQNMFTFTADSADRTVEQMLATSTGSLHDQLASSTDDLTKQFRNSGSSSCTINAAGLEALTGTEASVLVATRVTVTDIDNREQRATPYRLRLIVRPADGTLKVAALMYPVGGS